MISLKKKTTTCWSNKNYYLLTKLLSCFSRVQLCDLIDGSPPGSPVPGILQARTLEWVAISFSNAWKVKVKSLSRVRPSATPWTAAHQAPPSMGSSRQEYWSGLLLPSPFQPSKDEYIIDYRGRLKNLPITNWSSHSLNMLNVQEIGAYASVWAFQCTPSVSENSKA